MLDFVLYRIIGNDLPPRHREGQTLDNVRFILEHEPPLEGCEKRWVLNRIADSAMEAALISLLQDVGQAYLRLPFVDTEYLAVDIDFEGLEPAQYLHGIAFARLHMDQKIAIAEWCFRKRNLYAMNNNGARNTALREGRSLARWTLPFDGNCFFTQAGWNALATAARATGDAPYLIVPMARTAENAVLLDPAFVPDATEEPQIAFRDDAREEFDPTLRYGRQPKVALLRRLKVPGVWDRYGEVGLERMDFTPSPDAGRYATGGWVARLASGNPQADQDAFRRHLSRRRSIVRMLTALDQRCIAARPERAGYFRRAVLQEQRIAWRARGALDGVVSTLIASAQRALSLPDLSVADKTTLPPSGDRNDYWHPAPYWWPDPGKPPGAPYIRRDGVRRPDAKLHAPGHERYDYTRLRDFLERVTALGLAGHLTGEERYYLRGMQLLRCWFIDPARRMNPHLRYAQVRGDEQEGHGTGIIEIRDLAHALDAIRLICESPAASAAESAQIESWFNEFRGWLGKSEPGGGAYRSGNNVGTCHDLLSVAIDIFLADFGGARGRAQAAKMRIATQFLPDGSQPHEARRAQPVHYALFNLELWASLARLARSIEVDLWGFQTGSGQSLPAAAAALEVRLSGRAQASPDSSMHALRLKILQAMGAGVAGADRDFDSAMPSQSQAWGIGPYWRLGLR